MLIASVVVALSLALLPAATAAPAAARQGRQVALGAFIHNSYQQPALYDLYARLTGHTPVILGSYRTWHIRLIDTTQLGAIWRRGAVPMITWEPWTPGGNPYLLRRIARGRYDGFLHRSARAARAWGLPLLIRFAHEMNGTWYPWGARRHRNTPRAYIAAWRHIVSIFRSVGARNVRWVWCPTQNANGHFPFKQYYPGDRWVDWLALDGFNWSLSPGWQSFDRIFARSYNKLVHLSPRPIIIAETGSREDGGNKARWMRDAFRNVLPRLTHIRGVMIWSVNDPRGDLRVDSSPAALLAFRKATARPLYDVTRKEFLATPRRLRGKATVPVPSAHPNGRSLFDRLEDNQEIAWLAGALVAALVLALLLSRFRLRKARRARAAR